MTGTGATPADRVHGDVRAKWFGRDASVLLIADGIAAIEAEVAIADSGMRLLSRVGWNDAVTRLEQQGLVSVVLAEAAGADDATLAYVLPTLGRFATQQGVHVVVTLDPTQIDIVTANLHAQQVDLLCSPTAVDRFVALCLAGPAAGDTLHDVRREGEAARLRQLNEEVARIAETLARLTRNDTAPRRDAIGAPANANQPDGYRTATENEPDISPRAIRDVIRARRLRDQFFGSGLFEDSAWDMLLDLFAAEIECAQVSVSSLCIAAAVAPTTALRWITRMTDAGLFERRPDPFDRGRAFMGLSERASTGMRTYVAATRRAGLSIA